MELLIGNVITSVFLGLAAGTASKNSIVGIFTGFGVMGFLTALLHIAKTYGIAP